MATQPTANSKPGNSKTVKQLNLRNLGLFIYPFSAILNRMTTLEKLAVLVESIPADKQTAFQAELGLVVQNYLNEDDFVLSPEQEIEDKRRHADTNPKYATQAEVNHIWGKPLPS
ncbi:MAG: hypothetical protein JKY25_09250 [Robiginitomaculum sp.]|nr:hypothetical protein [Robiginitomaculum sp.]